MVQWLYSRPNSTASVQEVMNEFKWTHEHEAEWGDLKTWQRLYKQVIAVSDDKMMTLTADTVRVIKHWELVRQHEERHPRPEASAAPTPISQITCEGPWKFRVPKNPRHTLDDLDPKGIFKKQRCHYYQNFGCEMGDKCEWFHIGTDDEVRNPECPKYANPEWVVSKQSGMLNKYNDGYRSLNKAEWKMVLYCAEKQGDGQVWHSDQTPPGESHPIQTRGINECPRNAERKAPTQPADPPPQEYWPEPQNWGEKKEWSSLRNQKGWNKLDMKKESSST